MPTRARLFLAFALLRGAALAVMAEELPEDTNEIKSLDGSPTEDFVIPEWLEDRLKQQRAGQQVK